MLRVRKSKPSESNNPYPAVDVQDGTQSRIMDYSAWAIPTGCVSWYSNFTICCSTTQAEREAYHPLVRGLYLIEKLEIDPANSLN